MVNSEEIVLTEPETSDIIASWDRKKYPSFQDYLKSEEYEKWRNLRLETELE